mgnify:CR=1 FL=1
MVFADLKFIDEKAETFLSKESDEIKKMLYSLIQKIENSR